MWLVLRNIEETPSDLLSFLLPLVQENKLHVTSSMVIRPKLGFRPLTDLLHMTFIESLTTGSVFREDFFEILKFKYPALFV